jgi:hypothetical protein
MKYHAFSFCLLKAICICFVIQTHLQESVALVAKHMKEAIKLAGTVNSGPNVRCLIYLPEGLHPWKWAMTPLGDDD